MNEAFGGTFSITIILVFLVLISGYMAFNVNYSKAFKVKNKIVYTYEAYDGNCNNDCQKEITDYMTQIGYNSYVRDVEDDAGFECHANNRYCTKKFTDGNKRYYRVSTSVNFDIPIVNKILTYIPYLRVTGDTRRMECPPSGC